MLNKAPLFQNEAAAREALEALRWPKDAVCLHCGASNENVTRIRGTRDRRGLYGCKECRAQFTVTIGTIFERSRVPLHKWMQALLILTATEKESVTSISERVGVTYKTAWQMCHKFEAVICQYPGPNAGLGARAHRVLKGLRPSEAGRAASLRAQRKRQKMRADGIPLISQQRIRTTGALKPYLGNSRSTALNRLERVLLVLLHIS
jgi:transposase-like protein